MKRMVNSKILIILVLATSASSAQTNAGNVDPAVETEMLKVEASRTSGLPALQQRNPRYKLRPGDVVQLTFSFTPDFNQLVSVQPDGFITLREAGDIHITGLTVPELRQALSKAYAKVLREPEIHVELKEFEKPYFVASGNVNKPGKFDLVGDTTVAQAVALAGGLSRGAKHSQVLVFRRLADDTVQVRKVNLKKLFAKADLNEDLAIQPGDLVYVPESAWSKISGSILPKINLGPTIRPSTN